jgi:hypothetical protein
MWRVSRGRVCKYSHPSLPDTLCIYLAYLTGRVAQLGAKGQQAKEQKAAKKLEAAAGECERASELDHVPL